MATNCWPEAPWGGGGGWCPRSRGVPPPPGAKCISRVAIRHFAPLSTDDDLGMGVLLCGNGHGKLRLSLWAFHALLGGGLLAFERGGGGLNTLFDARKGTFILGAVGGGAQEGKEPRSHLRNHH